MKSSRSSDEKSEAFTVNGFPLLEFNRNPIDRYLLTGFALTWTADLTVVQRVDDNQFQLNGYAIFRNSDVKRWRAVRPDDFTARAARLQKLRPAMPVGITLTSLQSALTSAGQAFPLITIHRERTDRGACYIGKVLRTSQRSVTLRPISPDAKWEKVEAYPLKDITLVEFDGAYEKLLHLMAAPLR